MTGEMIGMVAVVLGGLSILTPIVAFSARYALRPIVDSLLVLRESQGNDRVANLQDRRIAVLESEIQSLQHTVQSLSEADDFRRQLAAPRAESAIISSPEA
ncbi:MAG: hypothetical protein JWM27_2410 [Gemmatimonadetes bacterium]|nr:hypothetical protein [Gemmatimonadota bacterium]